MIIINLKGGLGNQIFQYATGRALSLRQQKNSGEKNEIKLDTTGYGENNGIDTMRHYSLSSFDIKASIATFEEIKKLKYPYGIVSKGYRFINAKVFRQFYTSFNNIIFNSAKKDLYLDGFFQTEKYFIDQESDIRKDLTLKNPMGFEAQTISKAILNSKNSVSLHVRRGDYVKDFKTNKYHGTCEAEYYSKALDLLKSKIGGDFQVFVISDDINWVKENLSIPYPTTYVSSPDIKDYEELILMSQCKHNIIANSSFSWWGAWLNTNPDKIVIAPKRWVLKNEKNFKDICPPSWIRI